MIDLECISVSDCMSIAFGPMLTNQSERALVYTVHQVLRILEQRDLEQRGMASGVQTNDLVLMMMMIEGNSEGPLKNVIANPGLSLTEENFVITYFIQSTDPGCAVDLNDLGLTLWQIDFRLTEVCDNFYAG
ncbi:hypothetical protein M758_UG236900 [Ceratodon purpureus]|nr:hypothetical protein M758_UG236900 [Ceratodon purpureus]